MVEPVANNDEALRRELQAEYGMLQAQYENFDTRALQLKGLATPLLTAGLVASLGKPLLLAAVVLAALTLWILEVTWKTFQYCYLDRIRALEIWFRGEWVGPQLHPFQIATWWSDGWQKRRGFWRQFRMAWQPFIMLPYSVILLACLVALVDAAGPRRLPAQFVFQLP